MPEFDVVIKGGTIVDGLQRPAYQGDLAIADGRVAEIGQIRSSDAKRTLDASGLTVAPGFIDLHTHYDAQIHWDPWCTIGSWHGITTVAMGNCGFGFAPVAPDARERSMLMLSRNEAISIEAMHEGMNWDWVTFPEWMDVLEHRIPKGVNCMMLAPLSPIVVWAMGIEAAKSRGATDDERREMCRLLDEALDAGAIGWSTQHLGAHSLQADFDGTPQPTDTMVDEDLFALGRVLGERGAGFIELTYTADLLEGEGGLDAAISGAQEFHEKLATIAGRNVLYNSVIVETTEPNFHKNQLKWINSCQERGIPIFGQAHVVRTLTTFTMEHWNMFDFVPAWRDATIGSYEEKKQKLADPARRAELVAAEAVLNMGMSNCGPPANLNVIGCGTNPDLQKYVGRCVGDIAAEEGRSVTDVLIDLSLAGDLKVEFQSPISRLNHDADAAAEVLQSPYVIPGTSDGGAHTKFFTGGAYATDMLTWLVRDNEKITLEDAHYHLSNLPAQIAGLGDRGVLREGAPADVVVYDYENLEMVPQFGYEVAFDQPAGEWRRVQRANGYRWTLVNGEVTFEEGECTGRTPGTLIRNGRD